MTNETKATPGQARTAAARRAAVLAAEKRRAAGLAERGWLCIPPDFPAGARTRIEELLTAAHDDAPPAA